MPNAAACLICACGPSKRSQIVLKDHKVASSSAATAAVAINTFESLVWWAGE